MPSTKSSQTEVLVLAVSQLERATAATTALLDRNDEKLDDLRDRVAVIETNLTALETRLKRVELIVEGTLSERGLKERFHYTEAELRRIQHFLSSIDSRFSVHRPPQETKLFWDWDNPHFAVIASSLVTAVSLAVGVLLWKYVLSGWL